LHSKLATPALFFLRVPRTKEAASPFTRSSSKASTAQLIEPALNIAVATSSAKKAVVGNIKLPPELLGTDMPTLHQGVYVGASASILCGAATSIQGSALCNNAKARKKVIDLIEK
jgi:hypothetical protein